MIFPGSAFPGRLTDGATHDRHFARHARTRIEGFAADLRLHLEGEVHADRFHRVLYSTDASNYQVMPLAVVIPEHTEDVIATLETAAKYGLPVLPRGGGTSLAGQTVGEAVVIDFSRLTRLLELDVPEHWVRVEPGIVLARLNAALGQRGLKFGPDPATEDRATLGGIAGNNSTGSHSILYGMAADHIMAIDAILADGSQATFGPLDQAAIGRKATLDTLEGQIYRHVPALIARQAEAILATLPATWRRCGGYDLARLLPGEVRSRVPLAPIRWADERFNLARLLVGSEGTLAAATAIQLHVVPVPKAKTLAILHFDDLNACLEAVPSLLETRPSAVEMIDKMQLDLCRATWPGGRA